jgi:1-acyl-sn-glycerol-3-phosphate acyltransferase
VAAETAAKLTLVAYFVGLVLLAVYRARRSVGGWRLWVLYCLGAPYCRLLFRWRANRRCPFLECGSAIIIANHTSVVDPLLVWTGVINIRPLEYLTAAEYFGVRGVDFILKATRAIPVARDGKDTQATRAALRRLEQGSLLGIFPEGRINRAEGLLPANTGAAYLALRSQAPVFPVYIRGAPSGSSMVNSCFRPARVDVTYGDPIDLSAFRGVRATPELLKQVADLFMQRLAELGGPNGGNVSPANLEKDSEATPE